MRPLPQLQCLSRLQQQIHPSRSHLQSPRLLMDRAIYDPGTKTIMLQFERTVIQLDVEELLPMMEALEELFTSVMEDPDVQIGTVTEEDGTEYEEIIVKDPEEEYS